MINTLHTILVCSFVTVTALLLSMTVAARLRLRGVRMSWWSGRTGSLPVWPIVFIGLVLVFLVYAQNTFPVVSWGVFAGYLLGGALWFTANGLASTVVITDYGIIPEAGRSGQALGWGQMCDWFETGEGKHTHFVFLYEDFLGERRRLELAVPAMHVDRFRALVSRRLDDGIELPIQVPTGRKALEN